MKQKKMSLALKTFIGFGLGIVIGLIFQERATVLKPLGTIFLNMIKMIVVPLVFCSITAGVASLGDLRKLRSIGVKVVGLYALTSAISVALGLLMANITNPGQGFDMSALAESSQYEAQAMLIWTPSWTLSRPISSSPLSTPICSRLSSFLSSWALPSL